MKLPEFIAIQTELNEHCQRYPEKDELLWAIIAELGEFANARKGEWAWWLKDGKAPQSESLERQLDEAADILCFLLVGVIQKECLFGGEHVLESSFGKPEKSAGSSLRTTMKFVASEMYMMALCRYVEFLMALGYTREQVESAYMRKVEVNRARWAVADTIPRTTITQLFDRNEAILNSGEYVGDRDLVLVEAGAPCRLLKCRTLDCGTIENLMQAQVSDVPGDVAFKWVQTKNV